MSENKKNMLAKSVQKHAGRAKEKILQNLGKVDRTADDIFDEHLNNFNRQQGHANKLQKEFNNYIRCIRATQAASKTLMDAISEVYEPHWIGFDALQAQTGATESLWQDFAHKLGDQVLIPLNTYTGQFPEMKKKIDKRNRKLIDYDGQRHSFQSLQANANKRKDDVKLTKGREQLEEARRTYEILNTELHDELPALYDSRILFLVTNLQTLFATEQVFHSETSKIYSEMEAIVDKLATDSQRGSNTLRKQTSKFMESPAFPAASPTKPSPPFKQMNNTTNNSNYQNQITTNGSSNVNSPSSTSTSSSHQTSRLDSVSPTPESTPENLNAVNNGGAAAAATHPTSHADSQSSLENSSLTNDVITAPAYQNAIELLSAVSNGSHLNSPNANTIVETKEENSESKPTNNTHNSMAETSKLENENVTSGGSSSSNNDVSNAKPNVTAIKEVEEKSGSSATKKMAKPTPEPLNGNANGSENLATTTTTDMDNGNTDETSKKSGGKNKNKKSPKKPKAQFLNPLNYLRKSRTSNVTPNQCESVVDVCDTNNEQLNSLNNDGQPLKKIERPVSKNPFEEDEQIYEIPSDATTSDLPPGTLYRVKATYGYVKEDVDELSFEVGDIIRVIEYDDPEDQEEGWLMGQKEGTNEKGLFPANFTRPI